jgi:murein DD-endopeptidase MepM/ murein hydrolase activator NlpD
VIGPVYYAGPPVTVHFATGPRTVEIVRVKTHRTVRTFERATGRLRWTGVKQDGTIAANGRYAIRVNGHRLGAFSFHRFRYPIAGPHQDRGGIGYFGAPRNGGRTHEGFDVMSPCGTPVVAARGGRVVKSYFDPVLYGNLVIVRGRRTDTDYWYAHLTDGSVRVHKGDRVKTGQRLGDIGETGNARSVGCHLHFEIRVDGGRTPIDPAPSLHYWDTWS